MTPPEPYSVEAADELVADLAADLGVTAPEPAPWSPEDAVAALTALCAVYETKPRAWRAIPTELVREVISGERRA